MHSDSIILRDDFDSYHQQELNPTMWWVSDFCTPLYAFEQMKTLYLLNEVEYKLKWGFASLGPKYFGLLINLLMRDWEILSPLKWVTNSCWFPIFN